MKNIILLSIFSLFINSCNSIKKNKNIVEKHYFYFDKTHPKMNVYGKKSELRHLYDLDNFDPVIFIPFDSIEKKIKNKELKKYHVKNYEWLNNLTSLEADYYFFRDKTKKEFYLIEKRESDTVLYLRRVIFIQEID